MQETKYYCMGCDKELLPDEKPCQSCGAVHRNIEMNIAEKLTLHDQLKVKQKRKIGDKNKTVYTLKIGDSFFKKTKQWHVINRVIDRINDRYYELIKDKKTGKVIIEKEEKLSDHKGHGSAKYKNKMKKQENG